MTGVSTASWLMSSMARRFAPFDGTPCEPSLHRIRKDAGLVLNPFHLWSQPIPNRD